MRVVNIHDVSLVLTVFQSQTEWSNSPSRVHVAVIVVDFIFSETQDDVISFQRCEMAEVGVMGG